MWGAACVECGEGGEAAGGRLHTAMALLGLKVFFSRCAVCVHFKQYSDCGVIVKIYLKIVFWAV